MTQLLSKASNHLHTVCIHINHQTNSVCCCINMPRRKRSARREEFSDSKNFGSGSEASDASETHTGSPARRSVGPLATLMDTNDRPAIVEGTGANAQASAGGDGAPAVLASPPRTWGQNWQPAKWEFVPQRCDICFGDHIFGTRNSYNCCGFLWGCHQILPMPDRLARFDLNV